MSRWAGRTVATQLRFHLHFDDPRLAEEQRIHITGDREQLEALQHAVAAYVQDLLNQSPQLGELISPAVGSSDSTISTAPKIIEISPASASESTSTDAGTQQIYLKPSTGLNHSLFLASLATPATGAAIQLSVLQLFDLATALDEYGADMITLPVTSPRRTGSTPPAWASIAAVLTLAVGATVVLQQLNRSTSPQQTAINSNQAIANDPQQQLAAQPSPLPTLPLETLPPPPPTGSTVPLPNTTLAPIPVPNSIPASPTAPTAANSAAAPTSQPTAPQTLVINPELQRGVSNSRQATPNQNPSSAQSGAASSVPVIPIPSPSAQINSPNAGSQAAAQASRGATAAPQQQAATGGRSPAPAPPDPAVIDNINQVAEARQFFQRRWEPTAGVKRTLEYSLLLDVDGTIQRIEPIGQAAREQVDRTGMPLIGEPFVSPLRDGRVARIRVVLAPDGKVQTFLESREEPSNANAARQQPQ